MSLYKQAAKQKFRFTTTKGDLTVEELFKLPLNSDKNTSLESIAQDLYRALKERQEMSFTSVAPANADTKILEAKFEIVKDVIADRQAEATAQMEARKKAEQQQRLLALRDRKINDKEAEMSLEEIEAMLKNLGN